MGQEQAQKNAQAMPDSEESQIKALQEEVKKLQAGRSENGKRPDTPASGEKKASCKNCCWYKCTDRDRCPAKDKECNSCGTKGHFSRSERCKKKKGKSEKVSKVDDTDEDSEVMTGRIKEITVRSVADVDKTAVTVGLTSPMGIGGGSIRFL